LDFAVTADFAVVSDFNFTASAHWRAVSSLATVMFVATVDGADAVFATTVSFCSLLRVLQFFGGGGAFAVLTGGGLSFSFRRCDCQRGVGGAVVTAVSFFFGGIVLDGVVRGGILGEWGDSGGNYGDGGEDRLCM
jgi:hypothetical protein